MTAPAGLYVHLPFCRHRCAYCTFTVSTDLGGRERYLRALDREIDIVSQRLESGTFDTMYFGGGTPSLIPPQSIARLVESLRRRFSFVADAEVTLEANPEDVTRDAVSGWRGVGINRVSLGVQSLSDSALAGVGRRHSADQARRARGVILEEGFRVSCDLLIGLAEQSAAGFLADVEDMAAAGVGHLSIYALETDRTPGIARDRISSPQKYLADDAQADAYLSAGVRLAEAGFEHYEISSWARGGERSRHNSKYWRRTPTLGIGVSAHEYWGGLRRANTGSLGSYLARLEAGQRPTATEERPGPEAARRERIVLGARTSEGVEAADVDEFLRGTGGAALASDWEAWNVAGFIRREENRYVLTERGFLVSNEILCRFA